MNQDTDHIIQDPNNNSYKMYTCDFCNYKSERIWCINRHIKAHHKHPMFKCKHCDYQSNRRYNLKQHEKNIHGYQEPTNGGSCQNSTGVKLGHFYKISYSASVFMLKQCLMAPIIRK